MVTILPVLECSEFATRSTGKALSPLILPAIVTLAVGIVARIYHLDRCKEPLAATLGSIHNLHYYLHLMIAARRLFT